MLAVARTWRVRGRRREAPRRGTRASGRAAARQRPAPPRQPSATGWASAAFSRCARVREENATAAAAAAAAAKDGQTEASSSDRATEGNTKTLYGPGRPRLGRFVAVRAQYPA